MARGKKHATIKTATQTFIFVIQTRSRRYAHIGLFERRGRERENKKKSFAVPRANCSRVLPVHP